MKWFVSVLLSIGSIVAFFTILILLGIFLSWIFSVNNIMLGIQIALLIVSLGFGIWLLACWFYDWWD